MSRPRTVYRGKRKYGWLITLIMFIIVVLVILAVWLFYYLQRYIVYDKDGLRLDFTGTVEDTAEPGDDTDAVMPPGSVDAEIVIAAPDYSDIVTTAGEGIEDIHAFYVPASVISPAYLAAYGPLMAQNGANALVIQMKSADGMLSYVSGVALASSYGVNGTQDIATAISGLKEQGVYLVADISCLLDTNMALRNSPLALKNASTGAVFSDGSGSWLDPYNRDAREYLLDIIKELGAMGFDEVLLSDVECPQSENVAFSQSMTGQPELASGVSAFALYMSEAARSAGVKVSVMCDTAKLRAGESAKAGQDLGLFFKVFDRVFFESDSGSLSADRALLEDTLGSPDSRRTVPVTTAFTPQSGSYAVK